MQVDNKLIIAIVGGLAVAAGLYTGIIDISFLSGIFGGSVVK